MDIKNIDRMWDELDEWADKRLQEWAEFIATWANDIDPEQVYFSSFALEELVQKQSNATLARTVRIVLDGLKPEHDDRLERIESIVNEAENKIRHANLMSSTSMQANAMSLAEFQTARGILDFMSWRNY